jgi:cysteine synthase A
MSATARYSRINGTTWITAAHFVSTRPEVWEQTHGMVDGFICAIGTGGTLAGETKASEGNSITEGIGLGRVTALMEDSSGRDSAGQDMGPGHVIVTILADYGTRYQSKLFDTQFLREKRLPVPDWLARTSSREVPYART